MEMEIDVIAVVVTILFILLTTVFLILRSLKKVGDTVLIVGLSDSGKTHVFSKILNTKNEPITYTSLEVF